MISCKAAPIVVKIGDEVAVPGVKHLGINFNDTWWDSGAIARTRSAYNFEGTNYRSIFWGPKQDEGGLLIWQSVSTVPEKFGALHRLLDAEFTILNGPSKGEVGRIVKVERKQYDDGHQVRELDYLVFNKKIISSDSSNAAVLVEKNGLDEGHYNVVGAGKGGGNFWMSPENILVFGDTSPESIGSTAMQLDGREKKAHIRLSGLDPKESNYVGAWSVSFLAKATEGKPLVRLAEPAKAEAQISNEWKSYRFDFKLSDGIDGDLLSALLEVSDGVVLLDDVVFCYEESESGLEFSDALVNELKVLQPGILRYLNMGGSTVDNHLKPALQRFGFSCSPWTSTGPNGGMEKLPFSIHDFYELCAVVGADPWFSLPGTLHPSEVADFVEYLSAPSTVGYGKLRAELGQVEPWTDVFDEIIVEFGNEAWNTWGPFMGGGYNGPEYWEDLIRAGKESDYYRPNVKFSAAGQNLNSWLNKRVIKDAPNADLFAIATYMVHRLAKAVEDKFSGDDTQTFNWLFGYTQRKLKLEPQMAENFTAATAAGMQLTVYETNHHASDGDASSAFRNRALTSLGGGLNVIQNMMTMLQEFEAVNQCFFTMFGITNNAYAVKDVRLFGAVLSLKEGEVRRRPHYLAMMMANKVMYENLLKLSYPENIPMFTAEFYDEKAKIWLNAEEFPALRVLPFGSGSQRSVILINLSMDPIENLQLQFAGSVKGKHVEWELLHADEISANNELESEEPEVVIRSGAFDKFRSGYEMKVPAHCMMTLRWETE